MMPITTRSSTSVNPALDREDLPCIRNLLTEMRVRGEWKCNSLNEHMFVREACQAKMLTACVGGGCDVGIKDQRAAIWSEMAAGAGGAWLFSSPVHPPEPALGFP